MEKISICNAYLPKEIHTEFYRFYPIENLKEEYAEWEKENKHSRDINIVTAFAEEKSNAKGISNSFFYPQQPKVWDYCAILSLFQARNVFPLKKENELLFFREGRSYDWQILTSEEIQRYLDQSVKNLSLWTDRQRAVFLKTMTLLFEAEFFTHYSDLKDVWYFQPLELFCRGIYCVDHGITDPKKAVNKTGGRIPLFDYLRYCVDKFQYDKTYGNKNKIDPFLKDIVTARDWVMHGKVWDCPVYKGSVEEFTFFYRLASLLKAFLLSYLEIDDFTNKDALIHGIAYGNMVQPLWVSK